MEGRPGRCSSATISVAQQQQQQKKHLACPDLRPLPRARAICFETFREDPSSTAFGNGGHGGPAEIQSFMIKAGVDSCEKLNWEQDAIGKEYGKYHTALSAFKPLARRPHSARHYS